MKLHTLLILTAPFVSSCVTARDDVSGASSAAAVIDGVAIRQRFEALKNLSPGDLSDADLSLEAQYDWYVKREKNRIEEGVGQTLVDPFAAEFEWREWESPAGHPWLVLYITPDA